jgi:hypothetical protein
VLIGYRVRIRSAAIVGKTRKLLSFEDFLVDVKPDATINTGFELSELVDFTFFSGR